MRWKIIALGSFLNSRALACAPRSTAFYKGHGRSESLRQFGRPSPYIDGETGCLIQTDPLPIRRRGYGRRQVSASIQLRASSRIRSAHLPSALVPSALVPSALGRIGGTAAAVGRPIQSNRPATFISHLLGCPATPPQFISPHPPLSPT